VVTQLQQQRRQLEKLLIAVLPMMLSTLVCRLPTLWCPVPYRLPMQQHWKLEKLPPVVMRRATRQ
jgi:hypothetical protein